MQPKDLEIKKKDLIEKLGVYFEKERNLPPLAARILSTLILNGENGATFDELVIDLEASKSTISTHLNLLIAQKRIEYYTKCGDRKRYFTISTGYIAQKIDQLVSRWQVEIDLHQQVLSYKSSFNKTHPSESLSLSFHEETVKFLTGAVQYFEKKGIHYQSKKK